MTTLSFDVSLEQRLEYLTLAVGNAKSHPISSIGQHETAIAFLTDLEEKLEVAQVQLEMFSTLLPMANDPGEDGVKVQMLGKRLFNITEVCCVSLISGTDKLISFRQLYQLFAEPFDLPVMKLLIFHVSGHRDETMVRPIWNRIVEEGMLCTSTS